MKRVLFITFAFMTLIACNNSQKSDTTSREKGTIFFTEFDTPYGTPPFDKIEFADYRPAFLAGMEEETAEIDSIVNNPEAPTFENTIVALDNSGKLLTRVSQIFYGLESAETNDSIQALAEELSPLL